MSMLSSHPWRCTELYRLEASSLPQQSRTQACSPVSSSLNFVATGEHLLRADTHSHKQRCSHSRPRTRGNRLCEAGFTTLALCAAMVVMTGALIAGNYLRQSYRERNALEASQLEAAIDAEEALSGFVMANGRLPCPAKARAGVEDCTMSKGWLPVKTLQSDPLGSDLLESAVVRYVVYRGGGLLDPDLAAPRDVYAPRKIDGTRAYSSPSVINGLDLCESLRQIAPNEASSMIWLASQGTNTTPRRLDRAHIQNSAGVTNLAFGIAVAAPGAAESLSGGNADFGNLGLEDPDRVADAQYRDLVIARDASSLFNSLGCTSGVGALDTAAIASAWSPAAVAAKDDNIKAFKRIVQIEGIAVAGAGAGVSSVSGSILNLTWSLADSALLMLFGPTPLQYIHGAQGVATSTKGLAEAYPALIKELASTLAEGSNLVGYKVLHDEYAEMFVWDASTPNLQHLDTLGIKP